MRYYIAQRGVLSATNRVDEYRKKETRQGLGEPETYARLSARIDQSRNELTALLHRLKREGKRTVGYAATSKSTTMLNYCGIGPDLLEFICDTTPMKQGKFTPGTHIPVRSHQAFQRQYPDYALLLAWNHAAEIAEKEQAFCEAGGRWITYVPKVSVLEAAVGR